MQHTCNERARAMVEPVPVKHTGGCHCGTVRFEVWAPKDLDVYDCKYVIISGQGGNSFTELSTMIHLAVP